MARQIEFFQSSYVSSLDADVKKFIAENSADVVDCTFHILQADLPKRCQYACKLIWQPTTGTKETLDEFLREQCREYKKTLSDYEESGSLDDDLQIFDDNKTELLESTFDVILQYFAD